MRESPKLEGGWPQPFAYWAWEGSPESDAGKYAEVEVVPADLARELYEASAPYQEKAAPGEQLWSAEDYRNFQRLSAARARYEEEIGE